MNVQDFLLNQAPLAAIGGVAFGIINQAFKWTWRLAEVERDTKANAAEIDRVEEESLDRHDQLVESLKPLPRIEAVVTQLMEDRRAARS